MSHRNGGAAIVESLAAHVAYELLSVLARNRASTS